MNNLSSSTRAAISAIPLIGLGFVLAFSGGCATAAILATVTANTNATATIPFQLDVIEVANSKLPAVHSFSSASYNGKWLIIGGRTAGLHGFGNPTNNFPRSTANTNIYVIDPVANAVLGQANLIQALTNSPGIVGPLTASNSEFVQVSTNLYIVGGYGKDLTTGSLTTFGSIIQINVPGMIQAITNGTSISGTIKSIPAPDNRLKVAGGSLKYANGIFYLVFGQNFTGFYSIQEGDYNRAGGEFQKYNEYVLAFTLNPDLSINAFNPYQGAYDPNLPYHRRDLNVVDTIQSDGQTPGATVYGGVFKAGQIAGHATPIDLGFTTNALNAAYTLTNPPVTVQYGVAQGLSHYDCANLNIYDSASKSTFTTLFGGISQYHYSFSNNVLILDQQQFGTNAPVIDGLPFVNSITTIQHRSPGTNYVQFIQPLPLPGYLGTDAQVLLTSTSGQYPNGVVNLANLKGRTLVGCLYGGIQSYAPYSTTVTNIPSTTASSRLFQVYVTPGQGNVIPMPKIPTQPTPYKP